jgi:vesicle coat complex subunit
MVKLSTDKNIDTLLSELKEYASEVDYDFVKKAIRAIGQCAIKIDSAGEKCVNVLLDLIATRVSYVVQEAIIVIKVGVSHSYIKRLHRAEYHALSSGHLPQIPTTVRRNHPDALCESRGSG